MKDFIPTKDHPMEKNLDHSIAIKINKETYEAIQAVVAITNHFNKDDEEFKPTDQGRIVRKAISDSLLKYAALGVIAENVHMTPKESEGNLGRFLKMYSSEENSNSS